MQRQETRAAGSAIVVPRLLWPVRPILGVITVEHDDLRRAGRGSDAVLHQYACQTGEFRA